MSGDHLCDWLVSGTYLWEWRVSGDHLCDRLVSGDHLWEEVMNKHDLARLFQYAL